MSINFFELTDKHLKLLKHTRWSVYNKKFIISSYDMEDGYNTFDGNNIYEAIDMILNGKPKDFDPFDLEALTYTDEQIAEMDKIFSELPIALEIVLYRQAFEIGQYVFLSSSGTWVKK